MTNRWWWVPLAAAVAAVGAGGYELFAAEHPYSAEALVLVTPGVVAGRGFDGTAARDAVAVLDGQALVAYVRDDLDLEVDPPAVRGRVRRGSDVVVVRVDSQDQETVADVANSYALALVDVRGEQLRAGYGGAGAEIDHLLEQLGEQLASLNAEITATADDPGPALDALVSARDAVEQRRTHLLERRDDASIDGSATTGDVQVIRLAVRPTHRSGGPWWRAAARAAAVGAAVGLVLAVIAAAASASSRRRPRGRPSAELAETVTAR